jgi:hypothetical protein
MHARVMKWLSVATLLLTVLFWKSAKHFRLELDLVVSAAAAVVAAQALEAKKYYWVAGFFAIALTFNPLLPVFRPAGTTALSIVVFSIIPFVMALVELRPLPLMSIPSITDRNPGSRSL